MSVRNVEPNPEAQRASLADRPAERQAEQELHLTRRRGGAQPRQRQPREGRVVRGHRNVSGAARELLHQGEHPAARIEIASFLSPLLALDQAHGQAERQRLLGIGRAPVPPGRQGAAERGRMPGRRRRHQREGRARRLGPEGIEVHPRAVPAAAREDLPSSSREKWSAGALIER